ncbi:MAG: response regulator, partial [Gallionellaceae bacterium]|nr:response regulator [Gallionellaceae bacterium]
MGKPLAQSKVLVIDDFQSMRAMLVGFLKGMEIKDIDSAATAKEAISRLSAKKYDIVISDYNLGAGQNGQQILEEARYKGYIGYSTIWVMVTAEKTMDMFMGAAETRPDDYLLKPINEAMLEARFIKLMEKKKALEPIEKAVKAKNYMDAIAYCDEQLKVHSPNTADLLRIKSDLLITIGDLTAAAALFEKILAARSIPWAKTGLGKVYFLNKDFLKAKDIFQEVLDENKMYLEAADWLAKTLEALGNLEHAQSVLANAMELSPNSSRRQKSLADVAHKNGALDLAHESYEKAIKLSEHSVYKSSDTYAGLAKVLTDKDEPGEALKVVERTREAFKDSPEVALQSAVVESMAYEK